MDLSDEAIATALVSIGRYAKTDRADGGPSSDEEILALAQASEEFAAELDRRGYSTWSKGDTHVQGIRVRLYFPTDRFWPGS